MGYNGPMEKTLESLLRDLKRRVQAVVGTEEAEFVLYGSRARGDFGRDSDIDVAVIVPTLSGESKDRILEAVAGVELEHCQPVSVLVFSKLEFERLLERERRIALDIRREGVVL